MIAKLRQHLISFYIRLCLTFATPPCTATPGSGYVLLHHVMGELEGVRGAWGYPEGGMGAVSDAIAKSAQEAGAEIITENPVQKVLLNDPNFYYKFSSFIDKNLKYLAIYMFDLKCFLK